MDVPERPPGPVRTITEEVIEFVRHAVGGAIHVLDGDTARCGRRGPVPSIVAPPPSIEQICNQCWVTTPPEQRSRLITPLEAS